MLTHVVATHRAPCTRPKPLSDTRTMKHMLAIPKPRSGQDRLLTHCTIRVSNGHIVFKGSHKLGVRRHNRNIVKGWCMPLSGSQRNIDNISLRLNRLENSTHQSENILSDASSVTDNSSAKRLRKGDDQTEKNCVGLEKVSYNGDHCERCGCHWVAIPVCSKATFPNSRRCTQVRTDKDR